MAGSGVRGQEAKVPRCKDGPQQRAAKGEAPSGREPRGAHGDRRGGQETRRGQGKTKTGLPVRTSRPQERGIQAEGGPAHTAARGALVCAGTGLSLGDRRKRGQKDRRLGLVEGSL